MLFKKLLKFIRSLVNITIKYFEISFIDFDLILTNLPCFVKLLYLLK